MIYIYKAEHNRQQQIATPDQRLLYLDELTDIYLLSTQESAIQLSQNPQIKAQIELQNRGLIAQAVASDFFVTVNVSEEQILSEYNQVIQATPSRGIYG